MSTAQLTAGTVMRKAAALMNDVNRSVYTYAIQVPYLQTAMQELQEYYELHSVSVTESQSAVIQVDAGFEEILFDAGVGLPKLPDDMIEPQQLWERTRDTNPYTPMTRVEYLPHYMEGTEISQLLQYVWQEQKIMFLPANADIDIKIDYVKALFTELVNENSVINVINARSFLEFRTAGLLSEFIENNDATANKMNGYASLAMDRAAGISVKGKQSIVTRRRGFRSSYKRRGTYVS